jgi:hypothetical protein
MVSERPSGSFVHSSEKGIEYELEDEDEDDSGRIARLERVFFRSVRDLLASIDWSSSDDRAVSIPANLAPRQSSNRFRSLHTSRITYWKTTCRRMGVWADRGVGVLVRTSVGLKEVFRTGGGGRRVRAVVARKKFHVLLAIFLRL